jgi:ATP-dependent Clp protease ATP-binding subunit ClpC
LKHQIIRSLATDVREKLEDLELPFAIAIECGSPTIAAGHVLIALLADAEGITARTICEPPGEGTRFEPKTVADFLRRNVKGDGSKNPTDIGPDSIEPQLWQGLVALASRQEGEQVNERALLKLMLKVLDPKLVKKLSDFDLDVVEILDRMPPDDGSREPQEVFDPDGKVIIEHFSKAARNALSVAASEARGMGVERVGRELLMLGLLREDGLLTRAILTQAIKPRSVHENFMINARIHKRKKKVEVTLDRDHLHPNVAAILEDASCKAAEEGIDQIGESQLIRAALDGGRGLPLQIFQDLKVDTERVAKFVIDASRSEDEDNQEEEAAARSIEFIGEELRRTVIGQGSVVDRILPLIARQRFGYRRQGKPAGVFMFMGKSGTGKTMLAKTIARSVYGSEENLIMLEMGQFKTEESITMLIGASPGYKGYGEGKLTNGLKEKPECVVLFDEVEKAQGRVYDVLLRFLDEGMIDDPAGPVRDGSRCIIILTTNIGADSLDDLAQRQRETQDPEEIRNDLRNKALEFFERPELLNRIDDLILFNPLGYEEFEAILERQMQTDLSWFREEKGIRVEIDPEIKQRLVDLAFARAEEGARVVDRILTMQIVNPLIDFVISQGISGAASLRLEAKPGGGALISSTGTA